ncbi:MAG: hypothetical protein GY777_08165 [Candidatus Brocadiaceae bacterium]|nr:hypothetical protein [Candidatus Brocadiaceae bacterium]
MKFYIRMLCMIFSTIFFFSNVFADNMTMKKESFIRTVSSPLINLQNGQVPFDGILTGGQPTFEQIKQAGETGFRTVINLRTDKELPDPAQELTWVKGAGMKYIHIPVAGAEGFTREKTMEFAGAISKPENYPLIVHCKSGQRVGAMFALKAFHIDEKSIEESLAIGERAGLTSLATIVKKILESY